MGLARSLSLLKKFVFFKKPTPFRALQWLDATLTHHEINLFFQKKASLVPGCVAKTRKKKFV